MYFGQKHPYNLNPGSRYIVSLRTEGGVFRTWSDATQLRIEVSSGAHKQEDLPLQLGPEATIAYILLTPGSDLGSVDEYEVGLMRASDDARVVPKYAYEVLMNVQKHADPKVRGAACLGAGYIFATRPKCFAEENPDPSVRERLRGYVAHDPGVLLRTLQKTPSDLLPKPWNENFLEMLEIYADSAYAEVRSAACTDLRKLAPERKVGNCQ